jgi:uncharacterized protein
MVNHACNLRCTYCYTGDKFNRPMSAQVARHAIDRAFASLEPDGVLELGFFGGEPLIEATLIIQLIDYARLDGRQVIVTLTTNGTINSLAAWRVIHDDDVALTISHDGLPRVHDQHRLTVLGEPTGHAVLQTMQRLILLGKTFDVNMVVRPESVSELPDGIQNLRGVGVTHINLSLDLWCEWTATDMARLRDAIGHAADLWIDGLPTCGISWFDEKAARIANVIVNETSRCGFGSGEVAVAPSGRLYPCERLIGEDLADQPMRLSGDVFAAGDFQCMTLADPREHPECDACPIESICTTTCRCSNYVRSGDPTKPDRLLCLLNQWCTDAVLRRVELIEHQPMEIPA